MKILVFLFPTALFLIFLAIKLLFPDTYLSMIQEDSGFECAQALFYFISFILSSYISIKFLKIELTLHGLLYALLAIALLFSFGEEISWGQRIFDIENPTYFKLHNIQKEISLHNLDMVHSKLSKVYIFVGAYGAFAWIFASLFLSRSKRNERHILNFVVPDWFISSYFFFTFFIYTLLEYIFRPYPGSFLVWRDQEPMELILTLGFYSFVIMNYMKLQHYLAEASLNGKSQ